MVSQVPKSGILADPARAQHAAVADFEQAPFEVISHGSISIRENVGKKPDRGAAPTAGRSMMVRLDVRAPDPCRNIRVASGARRRARTDARVRAQPRHRPDAERGTDRQRHERVAPADRVDEIRHQVDRDQRQRESHRRLHRQHRAHARAVGELGDRRRELRGIGDDARRPRRGRRATSNAGLPPNRKPMVAAQLPLDRHRHDGDRRAPEPVGEQARARSSRSRPAAIVANAVELGGRRRRRGRQRQREARSRGRRRSTPTSHRAPTCDRDSRGWRGAAERRARPLSTARGSNGGDGARFGPMPAKSDERGGDERGDRRDAPTGMRQSTPPSALNRCGDAEPSVSAPTRMPTIRPMSPLAHVDGELHADRVHARHRTPGDEAQQRDERGGRGRRRAAARWRSRRRERARGEQPARIDAIGRGRATR